MTEDHSQPPRQALAAAIRHSEVVASFGDGDVAVRRVIKDAPD
jgi:hypothetical protein